MRIIQFIKRRRPRARAFCRHEQPCWCGLPLDPEHRYEINLMGASPSDLTPRDNARMAEVVRINRRRAA